MSNMANRCPSCGSPHINDNTCTSCGTLIKISVNELVGRLKISATTERVAYLIESAANSYERGNLGSAIRSLQDARRASGSEEETESINNFINLVGEKLKAA